MQIHMSIKLPTICQNEVSLTLLNANKSRPIWKQIIVNLSNNR